MDIKSIPQDLLNTVSNLMSEIREFDQYPPSAIIREWIDENREKFEDKYGLDEGTRILYAKAWNMFKENHAASHRALAEDCDELNCEDEIDDEEDDSLLKKKQIVDAQSGLTDLGEDEDEIKEDEEDLKEDEDKLDEEDTEEIKENYASPEPAAAVGFRGTEEQPKHADLLNDVSFIDGNKTDSYRLLIQYASGRTEFVPSTDLPGASTPSELLDMVLDIPDDNNVLVYAIEDSLDVPAEQPQFRGNDKIDEGFKRFFVPLVESFIDAKALEQDLTVMSWNNYATEWGKKDLNGLLSKLVKDVKKLSSDELDDELSDILPSLKQQIQSYWRKERKN